ncbi:MAG: hypothetical protein ABJA37_08365 [Ferruginibacter sp.]
MKPTNQLIAVILCAFTLFTSCKKTNDTSASDEVEATFELSGDQAIADNLNEDDNSVLLGTTAEKDLQGSSFSTPAQTGFISGCATITVTPQNGFPKTIVVDYGTGCTSNGIFRSGKINIVLSDSLRKSGSTAVMTFDNYFVNSFKREGTITWTNTSVSSVKSWQRKVENGKITSPDGKYWIHNGLKNFIQTAGLNTPHDPLDDVFLITGTSTVTNANGKTRNSTITEALQKKFSCDNIDKGTIRIDAPNHYAVIDFGDGTCDRIATISINGRPARTIILR